MQLDMTLSIILTEYIDDGSGLDFLLRHFSDF